jgi:hypothetical protein
LAAEPFVETDAAPRPLPTPRLEEKAPAHFAACHFAAKAAVAA